jgi:hypothetical protein
LTCGNCRHANATCGPKLTAKEFRQAQRELEERERERATALKLAESLGFRDIRSPRSQDVVVTVNRIAKEALSVPNVPKEAVFQKIRDDLLPFTTQGQSLPTMQAPRGPPLPVLHGPGYSPTFTQFPQSTGIPVSAQPLPTLAPPLPLTPYGAYAGLQPGVQVWEQQTQHRTPRGPVSSRPASGEPREMWEGWPPNWPPEPETMVSQLKGLLLIL